MNTITDHINIWITAQTQKSMGRNRGIDNIHQHGIKRLRELILELAVRGKLEPQDPNEEPARELLKNIAVDKEKLIVEGKIKKQNPLPKITSDEKPFELPEGWEFERWDTIALKIGDIDHMMPEEKTIGYPYISPRDFLPNNRIDLIGAKKISEDDFIRLSAKIQPQRGDIIYPRYGTIGENRLVETDENFLASYSCCVIKTFHKFINPRFQFIFSISPIAKEQAKKAENKTTQANVGIKSIQSYIVPLPPLAEQQRIVAKVDELMALCDILEQQQTSSLKTHQLLVKTLLKKLTDVKDATELKVAWQQIENNFNLLFTTEESIDLLKQTILQLAVMGKLTQDYRARNPQLVSGANSAREILKKIAAEKEKLIAEGKIKKQNPLPEITNDEKPFELPEGWEWCRLGIIGIGATGKTPSTNISRFFDGNIPFVGPGQMLPTGEIIDSDKTLTVEGARYSTMAIEGDILMVCIGGSIGKNAIVKSTITYNQQLNSIRPIFVETDYLYFALNSPHFQNSILEKASGSATPIINRSKWEELLISVPPLEEQHHIVAKVKELYALCNALKERIDESQEIKVKLADAVVEGAVKDKPAEKGGLSQQQAT